MRTAFQAVGAVMLLSGIQLWTGNINAAFAMRMVIRPSTILHRVDA